ncbi:phenylalanine--tRNA ligase subunit beta [Candidatus Electronema sp. TJ]|uniref:phenylalanine--tRNA ligase subunit beta n=1 Tax=Candidatus Electronema sp. TJ TaxID=3401573 RepID=UPI003AA84FD8
MKFTLSWLGQYLSLDGLSAAPLAARLTMLGLEVEAVQELYAGLDAVKTAKVLSVRRHPDADRLTLCEVEVGDKILPIVCGAPNVREGLVTAIALPGAKLPGGMEIKKAKVRGQVSEGMLCSWKELGISEASSGIVELDPALASGQLLREALGLVDTMIEVDLTPNRADCASVLGIAREVAGVTGQTVRRPVAALPDLSQPAVFTVAIDEPQLCPRYAARRLTGATVKPSPWWLQRLLLAVGMRPINNIVDITNFVMLEYGQPLHAFDYAKIAGQGIVVRRPNAGETTFTTLDGSERSLEPDMLLICDRDKPVAMAGVMGGLNSEVTDTTTDILLESACFAPVSIRRTARRLNLTSEASYRFERGVNPEGVTEALERAAQLICELAGATMADGVDQYPGKKELLQLDLRVKRVNSLLGTNLSSGQIAACLRGIEFAVAGEGELLRVTVPAFRVDIEREVDLIEEVARLTGYNEIPVTLPVMAMDCPQPEPLRQLRKQIAATMTGLGFYEAVNYSFVAKKHSDLIGLAADDPRRQQVELLNPLSEDQAAMRTMLLPGLLDNVRRNISFQQTDVRLFETGKVFVYTAPGQQPIERHQLCAVISGGRHPEASPLYFSGQESDLFDLKGAAQALLRELRLTAAVSFAAAEGQAQPYAEPGSTLRIMAGGEQLGLISKVPRTVARAFGIKQEVYFLELELEPLNALPAAAKKFSQLNRYPSVRRDIALLVPENAAAGDLLQDILDHRMQHVVYADIFDVYSGKPIEDGMKSVALTVTYRSAEGTLDDETVNGFHEKIVSSLMSRFGGRYREIKETA